MKRDQTGQLSKSSKLLESFGCGRFTGTLSNIRIWNTVRSQTQIAAFQDKSLPTTSPGLLAYYQFLERGEPELYSSVDRSNNNGVLGPRIDENEPEDPTWVNVLNCDNVARKGIMEEEVFTGNEIKLYPNPFNEGFSLEVFDTHSEIYSFEMYNLQGMKVMVKTGLPIGSVHSEAASSLPSGMYLIKVQTGSKVQALRIVKLR